MNQKSIPVAPGPLGWIHPDERTAEQAEAHDRARKSMIRFTASTLAEPAGPVKVVLTDVWKHPLVVADVGVEFTGFHQLTGSCQKGDAPVRMADGSEKEIQHVAVGDEVVTHTGNARKVLRLFRRDFTGDMVKIHAKGFPFPLEVTADHRVAVMRGDRLTWIPAGQVEEGDEVLNGWDRRDAAAKSLDLAELLGDRAVVLDELMKDGAYTKGAAPDVPMSNVCMARHVVKRSGIDWRGKIKLVRSRVEKSLKRHVPISPSLGRFIGLYLAEGGCETAKQTGKVVFTFAADEEDLCGEVLALAQGLFGASGTTFVSNERGTTRKVVFNNSTLAAVLKALVPGNVYTKRVPGIFFGASRETKQALLLGWLHGDGHAKLRRQGRGPSLTISGTSVCKGLLRDMTVLSMACGIRVSSRLVKARGRSKEAATAFFSGDAALSLYPQLKAEAAAVGIAVRTKTGNCRFGYARPVKRIEREEVENLPVFDIEVEEDHSYLSNDLTVHNCVGASAGDAIFTLVGVQRLLAADPTKAFIPWWPYPYGRTRDNEGDRGEGEGAVDSVMGQTLVKEGSFACTEDGLPQFSRDDGFYLTERLELQWSNGAAIDQKWRALGKQHPLKGMAPLSSVNDIKLALCNGYPVLDGCEMYAGHGKVAGSGANAYVQTQYDGRGGHSTCFLGYWDHPNDGPLYLYSNQWPTSTYPKDPAGGGRCCAWMLEKEVAKLFSQYGGTDGESMALSHQDWLPAQPRVAVDFGLLG